MSTLPSAGLSGNPRPPLFRRGLDHLLAYLYQEDYDPVVRDVWEGREVDDYLSACGLAPEPVRMEG